jgi:hypothetical protein
VRGPALQDLVPILDAHLTPDLDAHAAARYRQMKEGYPRHFSSPPSSSP